MDKNGGGTQAPDAQGPGNTPNASLASSLQTEASAFADNLAQTGEKSNRDAEKLSHKLTGQQATPEYQSVLDRQESAQEVPERGYDKLQEIEQAGRSVGFKERETIILPGRESTRAKQAKDLQRAGNAGTSKHFMERTKRYIYTKKDCKGFVLTDSRLWGRYGVHGCKNGGFPVY